MGSPTTHRACTGSALRLLSGALEARRRGDAAGALGILDRAIAADDRCVEARRARGLVLMEMGQPDRAAAEFERVVRLAPACARCELERGTNALMGGRPRAALAAFERAVALEPGLAAAHASRAAALRQLGRPQEALAAISTAHGLRPENAGDLHNRAVVRTALGQYREALRDYEWALAINPASGGSHNNLAWILATAPDPALRDGRRALHHARLALARGRNAGWLDTLAAAHAECGDFAAAVEAEAEACRRSSPHDGAFRRRLAAYRRGLTYAAWRRRAGPREGPAGDPA